MFLTFAHIYGVTLGFYTWLSTWTTISHNDSFASALQVLTADDMVHSA